MALVNPHPALKVAVPMNPMVDGWMGDDWFHNGAFREQNMPYIYEQEGNALERCQVVDFALRRLRRVHAAPARRANWAAAWPGADGLLEEDPRTPQLRRLLERPGRGQGAGRDFKPKESRFRCCWCTACGTRKTSTARPRLQGHQAARHEQRQGLLVLGPWHHGQEIEDAASLGAIRFGSDTGTWFRQNVLRPFLDRYLKDDAPADGDRAGDGV
jgi:uncharacterized protein